MKYFLFSWCIFQFIIFLIGFFLQKNNIELQLLNKLEYSVYISRGAGLCLAINPLLLLLPMCRQSITFLRKKIHILNRFIPDKSIQFHKICAYTTLFWALVHMGGHYVNFYGVQYILKINTMFNLHYTIFGGIIGHIMIISFFFIFIFSGKYFRTYKYELFWYSHHFFILMYLVYPFHGVGCFVKTDKGKCMPYYSGIITSPIIILYFIERIIRELRPKVLISNVVYCENDVFKFNLPKIFNYTPGQYIILNCPQISALQWHPFTISSSPNEDVIEVTIRCLGDWTSELRDLLKKNKDVSVKVDGVFGSPVDTFNDFDSVVLIATGIGITPYISIIKHLENKYINGKSNIKKIDIVWINRDIESFEWFNKEMSKIDSTISTQFLKFHIFLTEYVDDIDKIELITTNSLHHLNYIYKTNIPINYGRPDFDKFFNNYTSTNKNLKVGCFVCGPKKIETLVKNICLKYSNKDIEFVFKAEKFK